MVQFTTSPKTESSITSSSEKMSLGREAIDDARQVQSPSSSTLRPRISPAETAELKETGARLGVSLVAVGVTVDGKIIIVNDCKGLDQIPLCVVLDKKDLNSNAITAAVEKSRQQYNLPEALRLQQLDLTRDGKLSTLCFTTFPNGSEQTSAPAYQRFDAIMQSRYGVKPENMSTVVDPEKKQALEILESSLQKAVASRQTNFLFRYDSHGFCGGGIGIGGGESDPLDATKVAEVLNKYADKLKITIMSNTCRGGWQLAKFQEVFACNPELKGVTIITASDVGPSKGCLQIGELPVVGSKTLPTNATPPSLYFLNAAWDINPNMTFAQAVTMSEGFSALQSRSSVLVPTAYHIGPGFGTASRPYMLEPRMKMFNAATKELLNLNQLGAVVNFKAIPFAQDPSNYTQPVHRIF